MLIDTHAHLNFKDYVGDLDKVIREAQSAGVEKIICVSSNLSDSQKSIEIARKYPKVVYACVGIHPQKTDPENTASVEEQIKILTELADNKEVVAIGESGLDYSPAPEGEADREREEQILLFKKQIELSLKLNLPIAVHSRKAFDDTIRVLREYHTSSKNLKGVFHCFAGGKSGIKQALDLGFYFGIDGNVTYDTGLQNVVLQIPQNRLILETDAPFLTPEPHRGERNEPKYVRIIADFLAKMKNEDESTVEKETSKNAESLFKT